MVKTMNNGQPAPNSHYKGVVTDCNSLINSVVDMKIRGYVKESNDREDRLVMKMDELITIVKKEYTINRVLIVLLYLIDIVIITVGWIHINN
jgi:hypothetical protein